MALLKSRDYFIRVNSKSFLVFSDHVDAEVQDIEEADFKNVGLNYWWPGERA